MCDSAVQDMDTAYTVLYRICTVVQLRSHTAADTAFLDQLICLCCSQSGNKAALIIEVSVKSLNIC